MTCTWDNCQEIPKTKGMCKKHYDTSWRYANPDKVRERNRRSRERTKEHRSEYFKNYRLKNLSYLKDKQKVWREANPNYHSEYYEKYPELKNDKEARRRAKKLSNGVFEIKHSELIKLYSSPCLYCGSIKNIEADHVIPISRGGRHSIGNLVPACKRCNISKGKKTIMEWKFYG